jgi:hypothetical protein
MVTGPESMADAATIIPLIVFQMACRVVGELPRLQGRKR